MEIKKIYPEMRNLRPEKKRESTFEVLKRMKAMEKVPPPEKKDPFILEQSDNEFLVVKTIPESNILKLLTKIEALEKKMEDSNNYLSFFYEMRSLEDKFFRMAEQIEKYDFQISPDAKKRVMSMKERIEARRKSQGAKNGI